MEEIWKDIPGYEGLYQVSSLGKVRRLHRYKSADKQEIRINIRKLTLVRNGYYRVILSKNNVTKWFSVHRLVALAFIPNPDNLPMVNHKDEVKTNNFVQNLEWCDASYNINYGHAREKISRTHKALLKGRPVMQLDKAKNTIIATYPNAARAMEITKVDASAINKCCLNRPKFKTAGGYIWKYTD